MLGYDKNRWNVYVVKMFIVLQENTAASWYPNTSQRTPAPCTEANGAELMRYALR